MSGCTIAVCRNSEFNGACALSNDWMTLNYLYSSAYCIMHITERSTPNNYLFTYLQLVSSPFFFHLLLLSSLFRWVCGKFAFDWNAEIVGSLCAGHWEENSCHKRCSKIYFHAVNILAVSTESCAINSQPAGAKRLNCIEILCTHLPRHLP